MFGTRSSASRRRAALLAIPLAVAGVLGTTATPAQASPAEPEPSRASLTCQGKGVDPTAHARYRAEAFIKAQPHTIWNLQSDVERWPSWQHPAAPMTMKRLDSGPLRKHSRFQATIQVPGSPAPIVIASTVRQIRYGTCIRWTGPADGPGFHIDGTHVWNFVKVPGGVVVRTEETHTGPQAAPGDMGLETWLKDLKTAAEADPCH